MATSNVPPPRKPLKGNKLLRPDWTKVARDTKGVLALDKNENLDTKLAGIIADIIKGIPIQAIMEYPECAPYYHRLAKHLGIEAESLLFTPGSDGAIRTVFETFLAPGETVVQTKPSFAMYPIYTQMFGGNICNLEYEPSPDGPILEADVICESIKKLRPRIFCIPNPDSPTGTLLRIDDIEQIVFACNKVDTVALIDEAYYPFSDVSALPLINSYKNLVVAQTFAKGWGIAGLRLGFAAAHPNMAALLHKVRPMYEVNGLALAVMDGLLLKVKEIGDAVDRINAGKDYFLNRMRDLGFRTLECSGNFVHVDFGDLRKAVHKKLDGKVLYKIDFHEPCLAGFSRFTTAPQETMADLVEMIEKA